MNSTDNQTLLRLLTDTQSAMARLFEHRARDLGLNRAQWRVVSGLHSNDGATQTELAQIVGVGKSPLGKMLDRLEDAELVVRRPDPDDRRANRVFVTKKLESLVGPAQEVSRSLESGLLEEGQRSQLVTMLRSIHGSLEQQIQHELAPTS